MKFLSNIIFLFSIVFSNEQSFFDGFETGDLQQLDWFTQGDVSWIVGNQDSYGGDYSVQVDAIDQNQISTLTLNVDAGCRGDSQIQFYLKIDTEEYRDILHFYINGEEQYCSGQNDCGWSGNQDWQLFTFDIPQGVSSEHYQVVESMGNQGLNNSDDGNLIVYFEEKEHPLFLRNGSDGET